MLVPASAIDGVCASSVVRVGGGVAALLSARSNVYPGVYPGHFFNVEKLQKPLRHRDKCKKRPLYPQKRTCAVQLGMSALGQ